MSAPANPAAFPSGDFIGVEPGYGMSLRDWFAGQALHFIDYEGAMATASRTKDEPTSFVASLAYGLADAMLAAREQGK